MEYLYNWCIVTESKKECVINGIKRQYDVCSPKSLEEAKKSYSNFDYIGTADSSAMIIGNVKQRTGREYHFFARK